MLLATSKVMGSIPRNACNDAVYTKLLISRCITSFIKNLNWIRSLLEQTFWTTNLSLKDKECHFQDVSVSPNIFAEISSSSCSFRCSFRAPSCSMWRPSWKWCPKYAVCLAMSMAHQVKTTLLNKPFIFWPKRGTLTLCKYHPIEDKH